MKKTLGFLAALSLAVVDAPALVIDLDYTYSAGYFDANPGAKSALEKAASDVQQAITSVFGAVPTPSFQGKFGINPADPTFVTIDWGMQFTNPSNSSLTVELDSFSLAPDHFTLFVGARHLSTALGVGGGVAMTMVFSVTNGIGSEFPQAMANAVALSNATMDRGAGPVTVINDSLKFDNVTANYSLKVGPMAGVLSMDTATAWHFDLNTLPTGSESDFYSVALHEILHTLGFGTSETWASLVNGTTWTGPEAIAEAGGNGTNLISGDEGHVAEGTMSTSIVTGLLQEAAMDPTLTVGTRKTMTDLDLAFLRDIGFETVAVPEPATIALLGMSAVFLAACRRGNRA